MKKAIRTLIVGLILFSSNMAFGDGNELLSRCNAAINSMDNPSQLLDVTDFMGVGFCTGLLQGMTNLNRVYEIELNKKALFCTPNGITNGQTARIVVKYLKEHPEKLHENESVLAFLALQEAFPCK